MIDNLDKRNTEMVQMEKQNYQICILIYASK